MTDEELKEMIRAHRLEFGEFQVDWKHHRRDTSETAKKVELIQQSLSSIAPNVAHLGQLPIIAASLTSIDRVHGSQMQALINQTGAAGKSTSKLAEKMLLICFIVVMALGVSLVVMFIRDSNKDLHVDSGGLHITGSGGTAHASADNKKTPELVQ